MDIEQKNAENVTVATLKGEFDAHNLQDVSDRLDDIVNKSQNVVLNLKDLKFINSSALGYLIKTSKRMRELDGEIVLAEPSKFLQATIRTLGIDQIFKVFENDDDAVKHFAGGADEGTAQFEGVPVDEKLLGSTDMFFCLKDEPDREAVGKILALWEDGPTFKYPSDPDRVKIDPDELMIGRGLGIRFRQPFLDQERFFEMDAEIVMAMDLDDTEGASKFRLKYTKIDPEDEKILKQFVADQDLLRSEAKPEDI